MKKTLFALLMSAAAIVGVTSCDTNNNNTTPPIAAVGFVNASPNSGNVDIYLNSSGIVGALSYGADTGYYNITPGTYTLMVDSSGTTNTWLNQSVVFSPSQTFSVFLSDSASSMKATVIQDSTSVPSTDSVKVRYFHFVPNAGAVDFALNGIVVSANRAYNDVATNSTYATFTGMQAGTYTLTILAAGMSTVLYTTPVTLTGGKVYTLYAKGFAGGDGSEALSVGTVVHNE